MAKVKYCKLCGAYVPDHSEKCLACGLPYDVSPLVRNNVTTIEERIATIADKIEKQNYVAGCVVRGTALKR